MGGNDNGEFDSSPGTAPGVRPPSAEAVLLADSASILNAIATEYGKAASRIDELAGDERRLYALKLGISLRATARSLKANAIDLDARFGVDSSRKRNGTG